MRGSRRQAGRRSCDSHNMMVSERKRGREGGRLHAACVHRQNDEGMNGGQIKTDHYLMTAE